MPVQGGICEGECGIMPSRPVVRETGSGVYSLEGEDDEERGDERECERDEGDDGE